MMIMVRMMFTAGIQVRPVMLMIFSYLSNDGRVQKATNTRYSQTSQVIVMVMVVMVTMMTMTLVVWESSKCIAHMNHSPLSATLSFYDYSGHSASDRINYFERKILVTHKYIHTHL